MATTVIGRMAAILSLNSQQFTKGMGNATRTLDGFATNITRGIGRVAAFGGALVGVAGVGGLGIMLKSTMANIDATAKLADVLGLTTEQLTAYQHVAAISGVSSEELATGFRRMEKNISDAGVGLTTAIRAFDALGLSAEKLKTLNPDHQFRAIADAFGNVSSQADRARVAQDLFGRSGLKLLKVTELGSAGISKLQQEAEALGLTFSRTDAARVEEANDAITRVKASVTGLVQELAIGLAPTITDISDRVRGVTGAIRDVTNQWDVFKAGAALSLLETSLSVSEFGDRIYNVGLNIGEVFGKVFGNLATMAGNLFGPGVLGGLLVNLFESVERTANNIFTISMNLATNIGEVFRAAFESLKSGSLEPFAELTFKSLTEGTQNIVDPLLDSVDAITKGTDLNFDFKGLTEDSPITSALKVAVEQAQTDLERAILKGSQAADPGAAGAGDGGPGPDGGVGGPRFAGALQRGTTAEFAARVAATGGGREDRVAKDTEKNTDETAKNTAQMADILRRISLTQAQAVQIVSI